MEKPVVRLDKAIRRDKSKNKNTQNPPPQVGGNY